MILEHRKKCLYEVLSYRELGALYYYSNGRKGEISDRELDLKGIKNSEKVIMCWKESAAKPSNLILFLGMFNEYNVYVDIYIHKGIVLY